MKRDYNLQRLVLIQMRDGLKSEELKKYSKAEIANNCALMKDAGYVEGHVLENGKGELENVILNRMTDAGHDYLEKLEAEHKAATQNQPMAQTSNQSLSIFISHSAKDEPLASALVELLRSALNIPQRKIRCTSVNGYRLPVGANTEEQLRQEVHDSKAFIALITPSSIESAYVLFELGARWGAKLFLAPVLAGGADTTFLRGPLGSLNALNCDDASQVHALIARLNAILQPQDAAEPSAYHTLIDKLVRLSTEHRPRVAKPETKRTEPEMSLDPVKISILQLCVPPLFTPNNPESLFSRVTLQRIVEELGIHHLKAEKLVKQLEGQGLLIFARTKVGLFQTYELSPKGKDYLVDNNLLEN